MSTQALADTPLAAYALFMACNQLGQRQGKAVSGFHLELYQVTNAHAATDGVRIVSERIAWDTRKKAEVQAHFETLALSWESCLYAVQCAYDTGETEHIQKRFRLA